LPKIGLDLTKQGIENAVNYVNDKETRIDNAIDFSETFSKEDVQKAVDFCNDLTYIASGTYNLNSFAKGKYKLESNVTINYTERTQGNSVIDTNRQVTLSNAIMVVYANKSVQIGNIVFLSFVENNVYYVSSGKYTDLVDKPKLNGVLLQGSKTLDDVGIQAKLTAGQNITIENNVISASGGGGTSDYTNLTNKPSINGETLAGNKTSADLGLQDRTIVQGIDSKNYYVQFGMSSGKPVLILTEVTNE